MRCSANDEQMRQKATAFKNAASSIQTALDSASIILENRSLERRIDAQKQQLAELQNELDSTKLEAEENRGKYTATFSSLEESYAFKMKEAEVIRKQEFEALQAKLSTELIEKVSLEKQLAEEKKSAQGLLMKFGENQNEAQWKRKLTHLKTEHRDIQQQRDHYKKLCRSLQASKLSP